MEVILEPAVRIIERDILVEGLDVVKMLGSMELLILRQYQALQKDSVLLPSEINKSYLKILTSQLHHLH